MAGGTTDNLFTLSQVRATIGSPEVLTSNKYYYVRTNPATVTLTVGTPGIVNWTGHNLSVNDAVAFVTTGALLTPLVEGTIYYVQNVIDANHINISATVSGAAIAFSGSQSGTHGAQTGSDANDGLTPTTSLLHMQTAVDIVCKANISTQGFNVEIRASGVFQEFLNLHDTSFENVRVRSWEAAAGVWPLIIRPYGSPPSTTSSVVTVLGNNASWDLGDGTLVDGSHCSAYSLFTIDFGATLYYSTATAPGLVGAVGQDCFYCTDFSKLYLWGDINVAGPFTGGDFIRGYNSTIINIAHITFTADPGFATVFDLQSCSAEFSAFIFPTMFTNAITGKKYDLTDGSSLISPVALPGSVAGTVDASSWVWENGVRNPALTGTPGGAGSDVQYNDGSGGFAGDGGFTYGSGVAVLGTVSSLTGKVSLANAASANLTTIQAGNAAAARTYTWPTNFGSAGYVLTDAAGNGTLSWAAGSGSTPPGGSNTQLQFNNSSAFGGAAELIYNPSSGYTLQINTSTSNWALKTSASNGRSEIQIERTDSGQIWGLGWDSTTDFVLLDRSAGRNRFLTRADGSFSFSGTSGETFSISNTGLLGIKDVVTVTKNDSMNFVSLSATDAHYSGINIGRSAPEVSIVAVAGTDAQVTGSVAGDVTFRKQTTDGSFLFGRQNADPILKMDQNRLTTVYGGLIGNSPSAGIGYGTGAGGTVTQSTSKSTGVTLNKVSGQITMHNANLGPQSEVSFTFTNSTIAAMDVIVVNIASGASADSYSVDVTAVAAGSCRIQLANLTTLTTLGEALVLNFIVLKGVSS